MFARLFLLFTLLPLVEIAVLVWLASRTSGLFVLGLVIGTGFLGAWLARHQGLQAWRRIASEVDGGRMPGESLLDGLLVLLAAFLLILPGLLSDVLAIALLFPPTRKALKAWARHSFRARVVTTRFGTYDHDEIIDVKVIDSPTAQPPH